MPSLVAASAVFLAKWTLDQIEHPWNPTLEHYTNYKVSDLKATVLALQDMQLNNAATLHAIRQKYRHKQDYFDVIKTPMDFGTIRSNLESGVKYKNSEDVYKDVQYIWENCYKYNNKGDYILELMKHVKKNFMKNWAASGLYTQQGMGD